MNTESRPTLPPIPPDCPEFSSDDLLGWYFVLPGGVRIYLEGFDDVARLPNCRKHISYFARCAWRDEAERIEVWRGRAWMSETKESMRENQEILIQARQNAEAWRVWGEIK